MVTRNYTFPADIHCSVHRLLLICPSFYPNQVKNDHCMLVSDMPSDWK